MSERAKVRFVSGDAECAAWHYPGTDGACVVMAGGLAVRQEVAARAALRIAFYRPGRQAPKVRCPLLVLVDDDDGAAPPAASARAARRAPRGGLVRLPGGHYEAFMGGVEQAASIQLDFLARQLLDRPHSR